MNSPVEGPRPRARSRPRQGRATATRQRLYEAAMAEYSKVGLESARVEDIVAAAGVSWGTFFHYFPAKEDVLLDGAAEVCRAYSTAVLSALDEDRDTESVLSAAFAAMFQAAVRVTSSAALRGKLLLYVLSHPGNLTDYLSEADSELLPPVPATTAALAEGQRRGEIRADEPAESLAVILLYAVLFSARRAATIGRPPASTPLGRLALQIVVRGMRPLRVHTRPACQDRAGVRDPSVPMAQSSPLERVDGAIEPGRQRGSVHHVYHWFRLTLGYQRSARQAGATGPGAC